tara:strand:- start:86956 stop:87174 length:219 start_codon:yes stop_codon:yes gene_type:complete
VRAAAIDPVWTPAVIADSHVAPTKIADGRDFLRLRPFCFSQSIPLSFQWRVAENAGFSTRGRPAKRQAEDSP